MKPRPTAASPAAAGGPTVWLTGALIALAGLAAYANSFSGQFVFDDSASIADNPSIRQLWPLSGPLSPPAGPAGVGGRPFLNLSYALNYAVGRTDVVGYHAVNLLIHLSAGLLLFGIVRRTLVRMAGRPGVSRWLNGGSAAGGTVVAGAVALLWTVHPLQTASVTYLSQRAESMVGFFYLATMYFFIRYAAAGARAEPVAEDNPAAGRIWGGLCLAACLLGMATKEVMVTAPVMLLLYDRTWIAGTFLGAWRRHGKLHGALAATWLLLGCLVLTSRPELRGMGFGTGIPWPTYALTECQVAMRYLALAVWPHPLVLDYNFPTVAGIGAAAPWILMVILLLGGTAVALWRRPALGFVGAWFWIILAPSSSVVPVSGQPMAENRMYLPLAAVIVLGVLGIQALAGRRSWALYLPLAAALGALTAQRNADYRSELGMWALTAAQRPDNPRAHYQWATALMRDGRASEAVARYEQAVRLNPDFPEAWDGLGSALVGAGRRPEAIAPYERALRLRPEFPAAEFNLGNALAQSGRAPEAIGHYEQALRLQPNFPAAEAGLGSALLSTGAAAAAVGHYRAALAGRPGDADTHYDLALALRALGRTADAQAEFAEAARLGGR